MSVDDRPTLSVPDDDPWLWLEEIEGTQPLDFVERQNQLTLAAFGGAAFERDRDILAAIYDRPDNIPYVSRRGNDLRHHLVPATHGFHLGAVFLVEGFDHRGAEAEFVIA